MTKMNVKFLDAVNNGEVDKIIKYLENGVPVYYAYFYYVAEYEATNLFAPIELTLKQNILHQLAQKQILHEILPVIYQQAQNQDFLKRENLSQDQVLYMIKEYLFDRNQLGVTPLHIVFNSLNSNAIYNIVEFSQSLEINLCNNQYRTISNFNGEQQITCVSSNDFNDSLGAENLRKYFTPAAFALRNRNSAGIFFQSLNQNIKLLKTFFNPFFVAINGQIDSFYLKEIKELFMENGLDACLEVFDPLLPKSQEELTAEAKKELTAEAKEDLQDLLGKLFQLFPDNPKIHDKINALNFFYDSKKGIFYVNSSSTLAIKVTPEEAKNIFKKIDQYGNNNGISSADGNANFPMIEERINFTRLAKTLCDTLMIEDSMQQLINHHLPGTAFQQHVFLTFAYLNNQELFRAKLKEAEYQKDVMSFFNEYITSLDKETLLQTVEYHYGNNVIDVDVFSMIICSGDYNQFINAFLTQSANKFVEESDRKKLNRIIDNVLNYAVEYSEALTYNTVTHFMENNRLQINWRELTFKAIEMRNSKIIKKNLDKFSKEEQVDNEGHTLLNNMLNAIINDFTYLKNEQITTELSAIIHENQQKMSELLVTFLKEQKIYFGCSVDPYNKDLKTTKKLIKILSECNNKDFQELYQSDEISDKGFIEDIINNLSGVLSQTTDESLANLNSLAAPSDSTVDHPTDIPAVALVGDFEQAYQGDGALP